MEKKAMPAKQVKTVKFAGEVFSLDDMLGNAIARMHRAENTLREQAGLADGHGLREMVREYNASVYMVNKAQQAYTLINNLVNKTFG